MRQILVLGARSGGEGNVEMPPAKVELGEPMGLGNGRTECSICNKGNGSYCIRCGYNCPIRKYYIHFGIGQSCSWKKQGEKRKRFKGRMANLVTSLSTNDEDGKD